MGGAVTDTPTIPVRKMQFYGTEYEWNVLYSGEEVKEGSFGITFPSAIVASAEPNVPVAPDMTFHVARAKGIQVGAGGSAPVMTTAEIKR